MRSANGTFGKRERDVRAKVCDATYDALQKLFREEGYESMSEFIADVLDIRVHGFDHVASMALERLKRVAGRGQK